MKRQVVYFRKQPMTTIQGIAGAGQKDIVVGSRCPPNDLHGHGLIGSMELIGDVIEIRKVGPDGKPWSNYGQTSLAGKNLMLIADAAMVHISQTSGILFKDVADETIPAKAEEPSGQGDPPPAQPIQKQGQQRR